MIRLRGVRKHYASGEAVVQALRGVDLDVAAGEFTAIVGPSGSGKSTLLQILGLLDDAYEGDYWLGGQPIGGLSRDHRAHLRNQAIGFVFQAFHLLPAMTVVENVMLPALYAGRSSRAACRGQATQLLRGFGLGDRLTHRPSQLSSGQRQRTAIARALINSPRVLLADEPTGALDRRTTQEILEVLLGVNAHGVTILLITHDEAVASIARRTIHVDDGRVLDGRR